MQEKKMQINPKLMQKMHNAYANNPHSVDPSWRQMFSGADSYSPVSNLKKAKGDQVSLDAQMQALKILNSYREYGYLAADLNPIKKNNDFLKSEFFPHYSAEKADVVVDLDQHSKAFESVTLAEMTKKMQQAYCDKFAVQFTHIDNQKEKQWKIQ